MLTLLSARCGVVGAMDVVGSSDGQGGNCLEFPYVLSVTFSSPVWFGLESMLTWT